MLQINFRGSTGFGKAFTKAAIGQFAERMHDDLIDGVSWAVDQGYAEPNRVAIFGGSYGGYAALVGVTFTPDVFAAAIDYVGISDLSNFMRTLPEIARPHVANNWHLFVGNPDAPEQLADMLARSPITKVDQIRTPLLIIQGANDVRGAGRIRQPGRGAARPRRRGRVHGQGRRGARIRQFRQCNRHVQDD